MTEHIIKISKWWLSLTPEWIPLMQKNGFLRHVQDCYFKSGTTKATEFEWFSYCPTLARVKNNEENKGILQVAFTEFYDRQTLMPMETLEKHLLDMRHTTQKFVVGFIKGLKSN